jgi:hypothetical protein
MQPNFERMIAAVSSHSSLTHGTMVNSDGIPCTTGALILAVFPNFQRDQRRAEVGVDTMYSIAIEKTQIEFCIGQNTWAALQRFNDWYSSVEGLRRVSTRDAVIRMFYVVREQWFVAVAKDGAPTTRHACDVRCARLLATYWLGAVQNAQSITKALSESLVSAGAAAMSAVAHFEQLPETPPQAMKRQPKLGLDVAWESLFEFEDFPKNMFVPLVFKAKASFPLVEESVDKAHTDAVLDELIESTKGYLAVASHDALVGIITKL